LIGSAGDAAAISVLHQGHIVTQRRAHSLATAALLAAIVLSSHACYHAIAFVETDPTVPAVTQRTWVHSFLFGMIPPDEIDARRICRQGMSRVESQLTFWNRLVGVATVGLYTPMTITIACMPARPRTPQAP
jgi:hypothetical protein